MASFLASIAIEAIEWGTQVVNFGKWIGLLALILSLFVLWKIQQVVLLAFAAIVFATVFNRLARQLQKLGLQRGPAVAITMLLLLALMAGFTWIVFPPFVAQVQQLIQLAPIGLQQFRVWLEQMEGRVPEPLLEAIPSLNELIPRIQPLVTRFFGNFFAFFTDLITALVSGLLVIVLTVMFMLNPELYRHILIGVFPAFYRRRISEILDFSEVALVNWAIGIIINTIFIGTFSAIGLWLLDVPLVLANSFIAGFLEAIPNIGPTLSVIPPTLVALLDTPWKALGVVILYIIIQQVENYALVPFVMSKTVLLPPVITLLTQISFAIFFGFLGLFLALPIVVVAQVWSQEILVKDILNNWQEAPKHIRSDPAANSTAETPEVAADPPSPEPEPQDAPASQDSQEES